MCASAAVESAAAGSVLGNNTTTMSNSSSKLNSHGGGGGCSGESSPSSWRERSFSLTSITSLGSSPRVTSRFFTQDGSAGSVSSSPPSSPNRPFIMKRFSFSRPSSSRSCERLSSTQYEQLKNLEEILRDKQHRDELVQVLLSQGLGDAARKIRFFSAINEVLRATDKHERSSKASKVVEMFVRSNAKYHIEIPHMISSALLQLKMHAFREAGVFVLEELTGMRTVAQQIASRHSNCPA